MNVTDWEEALARGPLALRLSRIEHAPASAELRSRVLSGAHALKTPRFRRRHLLLAAGFTCHQEGPGPFIGRNRQGNATPLPEKKQQWIDSICLLMLS